jgi:hypothetical protein
MSAPPADVVDRLERLAVHAPGGAIDPDAVWTHGRRRQRVRLGAALAAVVAVGLLGTTATPLLIERAQRVEPAGSDDRMVLPDVIRQPGGWEPQFPSTPGRLSAVGIGTRGGLLSDHTAAWGLSATTGESRFLDLPDAVFDHEAEPVLSADGRRLAYWIAGDISGESLRSTAGLDHDDVVGVAVMDLTTGEVERWEDEAVNGLSVRGMAWAGDTLWWTAGTLTSLRDGGTHSLNTTHTWRWGSTPRLLEDLPDDVSLTTASIDPRGFLSSHGTAATGASRVDLTGEVTTIRFVTDEAVSSPHLAPDGRRVAGMEQGRQARVVLADLPLLVGTIEGSRAVMDRVNPVAAEMVVGWRSPTEVVLLHGSPGGDTDGDGIRETRELWVADLSDLDRPGFAPWIWVQAHAMPQFAADALAGDVVPAPDAPFAPDPRLVGLGLLVAAFVGWRIAVRVRSRRVHA